MVLKEHLYLRSGQLTAVASHFRITRYFRWFVSPTCVLATSHTGSCPPPPPSRDAAPQVRDRLAATRRRMEDVLSGREPAVGGEAWYESEDELAEPLMACYWCVGGGGRKAELLWGATGAGMTGRGPKGATGGGLRMGRRGCSWPDIGREGGRLPSRRRLRPMVVLQGCRALGENTRGTW